MSYIETQKLEYAPLIAGLQMPIVTKKVTVAQSAEIIKKGSVMELDASSKKAKLATTDVYGVALHDIDAKSGEVVAELAITGEFVSASLVFGGGKQATELEEKAEARNIYFR